MTTELNTVRKPFEPTKDFTMVHNALFTLYTRLPKFKACHGFFYTYLMARYNVRYGYAYPTTEDIMRAMNCSKNVVTEYKRVLTECGLVTVRKNRPHSNDVYYVHTPITDEAAFYARFPEAKRRPTGGEGGEELALDDDEILAYL